MVFSVAPRSLPACQRPEEAHVPGVRPCWSVISPAAIAVVLAIALRRRLRDNEYPRCAADLVIAATADPAAPGASALRMWLQQALQLHPRSMFASAIEAQRGFLEITSAPGLGRTGGRALSALLQPSAC